MISVKNLNKYYSKGRSNEVHVINGITAELPDRGITAIFGRSGCGKTTLLNVIGGLDGFNGGEVLIGGESVTKNTDDLRNREIGYIFQNYNLNKLETVFENVSDALKLCGVKDTSVIEERVMSALSMVDMEKYYRRTPDTLSGGQQQRVAIARAIVKSPKIILADEPTGNLDEENTVMVMNLLHKIAEDRLVVLVTHEQNLVDYYCDTVIELSDGKITDIRRNGTTGGYSQKSKNDIYLGEFEKKNVTSDVIETEYYGELPKTPIKLNIVNNNGHIYLRIDTPGIQVLDETSEVKLREGSYAAQSTEIADSALDMSKLTPLSFGKTGKLFSFASALKSGFRANFRSQGKGKRALLSVMAMFSAVMVLMTALFGSTVKQLIDIDKSYNHKAFYVYLPDETTYSVLKNAENAGIGYMYMNCESFFGDITANISGSWFESAAADSSYSDMMIHGAVLPWSQMSGYRLIAGKNGSLAENEMVISSACADDLIENSAFSFIKDYGDIPGMYCNYIHVLSSGGRIAGVVESDDPLIFVSDDVLLRLANGGDNILRASDFGFDQPADGECIYLSNNIDTEYDQKFADEAGKQEIYKSEEGYVTVRGRRYRIAGYTDNDKLSEIYTREMQKITGNESRIRVIDYRYYSVAIFVNDAEYVRLAESFGVTDSDFDMFSQKIWVYKNIDKGDYSFETLPSRYAVLYSDNPELTDSFLKEKFPSMYDDASQTGIISPGTIRRESLASVYSDMLSQSAAFIAFTAVMCLCMFFIMRSSMISRVKEIGVYRAIGVKKGNIIFRFFVESAVVTTLAVFVTYLLSSGVIFLFTSLSSSTSIIYYPAWMALCLLVFQYAVCLFFGTLPVISLLRRTPSEILAKYDI